MNSTPMVSVIMPAYNAESTLRRAVLSVVHQTFTNWELLIIDDASTDNTLSVAKEIGTEDLRIRVVPSPVNQGAAASRNKGVQQCKGAYVAFIDSDDVWCPEKLDKQLRLIADTGADLCYTAYAIVNLAGDKVRADYYVPDHTSYEALLCENVIGCSTVLLSAALVRSHPFATNFYHEDYSLWLTLLKEGCQAVGCNEVLVKWCLREGSRSYSKLKSLKMRWKIYRDQLHMPLWRRIYFMQAYIRAGLKKYKKIRTSPSAQEQTYEN